MSWRERDRDNKEHNGAGPPFGQVRVLAFGESGVGKTYLVHLIIKGFPLAQPPQTVGCTVSVKHITRRNSGSSSNSIKVLEATPTSKTCCHRFLHNVTSLHLPRSILSSQFLWLITIIFQDLLLMSPPQKSSMPDQNA